MLVIFLMFIISINVSSIFLSDYLEEGQTRVYETEDGVYVVSLLSVADAKEKAVFRLNDEMSKGIKKGDSYVFKDGSEIVLRDLVISDAKERNDEAYYYFYGTGKEVLKLKNVSRNVVENKLCNFDSQCLNESKEDCCYDCGCNEGERCENNRCVLIEEEKDKVIEEDVVKEEIKAEEKKEIRKEERGKKAVYAMLIIMLALSLFIGWRVWKKRKNIF